MEYWGRRRLVGVVGRDEGRAVAPSSAAEALRARIGDISSVVGLGLCADTNSGFSVFGLTMSTLSGFWGAGMPERRLPLAGTDRRFTSVLEAEAGVFELRVTLSFVTFLRCEALGVVWPTVVPFWLDLGWLGGVSDFGFAFLDD